MDSDEESLAGLTQTPSQDKINKISQSSSDDDDDDFFGFNLKPASELVDCSQNKEADFSQFVTNICESDGDGDFQMSPDLFDSPDPTQAELDILETASHSGVFGESSKAKEDDMCERSNDDEVAKYCPETSDISDGEVDSGTADKKDSSVLSVTSVTTGQRKMLPGNHDRFRVPRTDATMDKYSKKRVGDATLTKIDWALRVFQRWIEYRRSLHFKRVCYPVNRTNRYVYDLSVTAKSDFMITRDICDFITEARKENGNEYPPATIYDLVLMLSIYMEREFGTKKLISEHFPEIKNTLDHVMVEKSALGLAIVRSKDDITIDQEEFLWTNNFLGEDTPDKLRLTVLYLVGLNFGLRAGKEHRDLMRYPVSQFQLSLCNDKECIIYSEFSSKNKQGGLRERHAKNPKKVISFCSGFEPRCLVSLVRKYLSLCPPANAKFSAFYLRTDPRWQENGRPFWYLRLPVGKNQLNDYVKNVMKAAGFEGNFSNHSLRATTCSRLYQQDVDEQLIAERTGHSSTAIRRYKHTSLKQQNKISDYLQVLPSQVSQESSQEEKVPKSVDGKGVKKSTKKASDQYSTDENDKQEADECQVKNQGVVGDVAHSVNVNIPTATTPENLKGLINIHFHFNK